MENNNINLSKSYCIRLDKGDEIITSLLHFCKQNKITSGNFAGIGATNKLVIGCFDPYRKQYVNKTFKESMEILSIKGNITLIDKQPFVHAHMVVCNDKFITFGGHVQQCFISLTCEIYLTSYKQKIKRVTNDHLGIKTIKFK